ncbi:hypothetical protein K438DRAFT_1998590 [Mycena galopus ATCC 62051]|nr:hypothetical protein K438DRAFT_1998590 [Mycena galopus ATCC 62051]
MSGIPSLQEPSQQLQPQSYPRQYSVTALHDYLADPDDPFEISFSKGDVLDIVDQQGKWWWVIKADGTVGMAPSNFLRNGRDKVSVTALRDYTANGDDKNEISFIKGETLRILDQQGKWWQIKKADGSVGYAPSSHLSQDPDVDNRKSFSREINSLLGTFMYWQNQRLDESTGLAPPSDLAEQALVYKYKAKARVSYTADVSDPNELSFRKDEVLEIAHKRGRWLVARKADGSTGIAPSTFVEITPDPNQEVIDW